MGDQAGLPTQEPQIPSNETNLKSEKMVGAAGPSGETKGLQGPSNETELESQMLTGETGTKLGPSDVVTKNPDVRPDKGKKVPTSVRNRLRQLRAYGVDTSKLTLQQAKEYSLKKAQVEFRQRGGKLPKPAAKIKKHSANDGGKRAMNYRTPSSPNPTSFRPPSYRNAPNSNPVRVAVIPRGFPAVDMSEEEADYVKKMILDAMDTMKGKLPQFEGCRYMEGFLGLLCKDRENSNILSRLVNEIRGGRYLVVDAKDVPPRYVKVVMYLPEPTDLNIVRSRLERQNVPLSCKNWQIFNCQRNEMGQQRVCLWIDAASNKLLADMDYRPYCGVGRVTIRPIQGIKEEGELADESVRSTYLNSCWQP